MAGRRNVWKLALLTTALGLVVLGLAAVACAPAAPSGQASGQADPDAPLAATATPTLRWLGDTPWPSQLATLEAIPTATPYPPGYVKPTDLPTYTPVPPPATLMAQMWARQSALQTRQAQMQTVEARTRPAVSGGVAGAGGSSSRDGHEEALAQIAAHMALGEYYAIVKVRVIGTRVVPVPYIAADPQIGESARRDTVEVITTYRGSMSKRFDIVTHYENEALEVGREYILSVYRYWVLESEYPPGDKGLPFTPETLKAAGGKAYTYDVGMVWIIDSGLAMYVPSSYTVWGQGDYSNHLEAGRGNSIRLPLPTIEAAMRRR